MGDKKLSAQVHVAAVSIGTGGNELAADPSSCVTIPPLVIRAPRNRSWDPRNIQYCKSLRQILLRPRRRLRKARIASAGRDGGCARRPALRVVQQDHLHRARPLLGAPDPGALSGVRWIDILWALKILRSPRPCRGAWACVAIDHFRRVAPYSYMGHRSSTNIQPGTHDFVPRAQVLEGGLRDTFERAKATQQGTFCRR